MGALITRRPTAGRLRSPRGLAARPGGGAYVSQGFGEGDDGPRKTNPRNQEGKRRTTEKEQGQKGRREGEAINNSSRTAEQQGGGRFSLTDDGDAMVQVAVIKGTVA